MLKSGPSRIYGRFAVCKLGFLYGSAILTDAGFILALSGMCFCHVSPCSCISMLKKARHAGGNTKRTSAAGECYTQNSPLGTIPAGFLWVLWWI